MAPPKARSPSPPLKHGNLIKGELEDIVENEHNSLKLGQVPRNSALPAYFPGLIPPPLPPHQIQQQPRAYLLPHFPPSPKSSRPIFPGDAMSASAPTPLPVQQPPYIQLINGERLHISAPSRNVTIDDFIMPNGNVIINGSVIDTLPEELQDQNAPGRWTRILKILRPLLAPSWGLNGNMS